MSSPSTGHTSPSTCAFKLAEAQCGRGGSKELVGDFKNPGRCRRPTGDPVPVRVHDFADPQLGKAIPYGIYDLAANTGWVNVGTDHDTAAFAVESIRRWWRDQVRAAYPRASRLLVTADAGGSNGYRTRAWKLHLARLASGTGLTITACHLPPGTQCRCLNSRTTAVGRVTVSRCGSLVRSCIRGVGCPTRYGWAC